MPEKTVKRRLQDCDAALASDDGLVDELGSITTLCPKLLALHALLFPVSTSWTDWSDWKERNFAASRCYALGLAPVGAGLRLLRFLTQQIEPPRFTLQFVVTRIASRHPSG